MSVFRLAQVFCLGPFYWPICVCSMGLRMDRGRQSKRVQGNDLWKMGNPSFAYFEVQKCNNKNTPSNTNRSALIYCNDFSLLDHKMNKVRQNAALDSRVMLQTGFGSCFSQCGGEVLCMMSLQWQGRIVNKHISSCLARRPLLRQERKENEIVG